MRRVGLVVGVWLVAVLALPAVALAARSWSPASLVDTGGGTPLVGLACPSPGECVALDGIGRELTFNPQYPAAPTPVPLEIGVPVTGLACPTTSECVAVDGFGNALTFDPTSPGTIRTTEITANGVLNAVSCPTATQCTAVDSAGDEVTFDPASPATNSAHGVGAQRPLNAISCPLVNECVATDSIGDAVVFDPTSTATSIGTAGLRGVSTQPLLSITCASTVCVAGDTAGTVWTFPTSGGAAAVGSQIDGQTPILDISCTDPTHCVAVDAKGAALLFDATTQRAAPTSQVVLSFSPLAAVHCFSASVCLAAASDGTESTFDPASSTAPAPVAIDPSVPALGLACADTTQCMAVDADGRELTFDPLAVGTPSARQVDGQAAVNAVTCLSSTSCLAVDDAGNLLSIQPSSGTANIRSLETNPLEGIACPTSIQCTVIDDSGGALTFNPTASFHATPFSLDGQSVLTGIACPSRVQCTATDDRGVEITFDPNATTAERSADVPSGAPITGIACPSTSSCTIVDASGSQATFNPESAQGALTVSTVTQTGTPVALSCPSAGDCVAAAAEGNALESTSGSLTTPWTPEAIAGANELSAIACPVAQECAAVDLAGDLSVGLSGPVNTVSPGISGADVVGSTLTESHGTWTENPTSFTYQWEDCNVLGVCVPIPGATQQTYTLASSDAGLAVRVLETASGGTATASAPTSVVTEKPRVTAAPQVTGTATPAGTLAVSQGSWAGTAPITYTYAWFVCHPGCTAIAGATLDHLRPTAAEVGEQVGAVVVAHNVAGQTVTVAQGRLTVTLATAAVRAALRTVRLPARLPGGLGGVRVSFRAPSAGRLTVTLEDGHVRVASASVVPTRPGSLRAPIRFTAAGRRLLASGRRIELIEMSSFTPLHGARTSVISHLSVGG